MTIEAQIAELVEKYRQEDNKSQSEADVRAGYIDRLFIALGWNVYNDPGGTTNYRREGYISGAGRADVGLEIAGKAALILEAKKFGALVKSDKREGDRSSEEKQLFRYARAKNIPYCILTNFERLHVFNADHERLVLAFDEPDEFITRLPDLMHLMPEKIKAGSLPSTERQLQIKPIDEEFLASLQDWRLRLANVIYEHNRENPELKSDGTIDFAKLMAAVQRLLDRLILIRYADDKEVLREYDVIETILTDYHRRGAYARADHLIRELTEFAHVMDEHHNTSLFKPDHICEKVVIPNEPLEKIMTEINNISFRKFTSDILGNTYETYLGTKLTLKKGVIVSEERTDIRKAGGIYYTPSFIVHYMVDNTLGQRIEKLQKEYGLKAIDKIKELRIVDPACGSGSFLIYAYHVLADYYRKINEAIEAERVKLLAGGAGADMFQRLEMFKQFPEQIPDYPHHILEKQLYGVDLDPEAAEIAAVNLTMQAFSDTKREKLPLILNQNIKVGNSLVSGTEDELQGYFGEHWRDMNAFDWKQEFPEVMDKGGFDIVMGNPPYVRQEKLEIKTALEKYECYTGTADIYVFFFERGLQILKEGGMLTYISPNKYFRSAYGEKLRGFLASKATISKLIDFGDAPVFNAITYPSIIVLEKIIPTENMTRVFTWKTGPPLEEFRSVFQTGNFTISQKELKPDGWRLEAPAVLRLLEKLRKAGKPLGEYFNGRLYRGIITGLNEAFVVDRETRDRLIAEHESSAEIIKPFLRGRDVKRWSVNFTEQYLIKIESSENKIHPWSGKTPEEAEKIFAEKYPAIHTWFQKYRRNLIKRDDQGKYFWELRSCRYWEEFEKPKIIYPDIYQHQSFAIDRNGYYCGNTCYFIPSDEIWLSGLCNSRVIEWFYSQISSKVRGGYLRAFTEYMIQIPVPPMDNPEHMTSLVLKLTTMDSDNKKDISAIESEIDQIVYGLYGLTEEEVGVVEGALNN